MRDNRLSNARNLKNDEFYTLIEDVEREVGFYRDSFRGSVVLCNCNDSEDSAFWRYFCNQFRQLELRKVIAITYIRDGRGQKIVFDGNNGIEKTELPGNGDFRSQGCIEILKEADIVCTNPPFSLFRSYVAQLVEYKKKFLVIGNKNALTYKSIFPLIKDNKLWLGCSNPNKFVSAEGITRKVEGLCRWFTNLENTKCQEKLVLKEKYIPERYSKYDNYDAINVNKVLEIPIDYYGVMGVPVTFLDKYNPEQFEIIGHEHDINGNGGEGIKEGQFEINSKGIYKRILIRRK